MESTTTGHDTAERVVGAGIPQGPDGEGATGAPEETGRRRRLPLVLGTAAIAGLVGWIVVAGRRARRTVLGVRLPWAGSRSPTEVLGDGAREVGRTVGRMPGAGRVRGRIAGTLSRIRG